MRVALAVALLCLAGCAAPVKYTAYKENGSQAEYERDLAQCEYEVVTNTQNVNPIYRSSLGQEIDRAMRQRELGMLCMKARGYKLIPQTTSASAAAPTRATANPSQQPSPGMNDGRGGAVAPGTCGWVDSMNWVCR